MKTILQHDERDCGAACLAMILDYYGYRASVSQCRRLTKTDATGANLYGLVDGAVQLGLKGTAYGGDAQELRKGLDARELRPPLLAQIVNADGYLHFVVLEAAKGEQVILRDPGLGKVKLSWADFAQVYQGYIASFEPTPEFRRGNTRKGSFLKFFQLLSSRKRVVTAVILLSLLTSLLGIAATLAFQVIVDDAIYRDQTFAAISEAEEATHADEDVHADGEDAHTHEDVHADEDESDAPDLLQQALDHLPAWLPVLSAVCLGVIVLYLLLCACSWFRGKLVLRLALAVDRPLVMGFFEHVLDLPIGFFETQKSGEILTRFSDTADIRDAICDTMISLVLNTFQAIVCGVVLGVMNLRMLGLSLCIFVCYALSVLAYSRWFKQRNQDMMEQNARVTTYLKESVDGAETIKAFGAESMVKRGVSERYGRLLSKVYQVAMVGLSQETLSSGVEMIGRIAVLWLGSSLVVQGLLTLGTMIAFVMLLDYFLSPLKDLVSLQPVLQRAMVAASRLNDYLEIETEPEQSQRPTMTSDIHFEAVDFRYGNNELLLKQLSFTLPFGARIAIVGKSGSGKTTLAKLLTRLYAPESGRITVGDSAWSAINSEYLRRHVAYIPQQTFLFADSIANNVLIGRTEFTKEQAREVCRRCGLDDVLARTPQGIDAMLEENGSNLSGGQRQRLAIARALLANPTLLILDEATSHLDTVSERGILRMLRQRYAQTTCVMIAHNLETVACSDVVLVMKDGRIVQTGTHEALLKAEGEYSRMWREGA